MEESLAPQDNPLKYAEPAAVEVVVEGLLGPLCYAVPALLASANVGDEVVVPLGRRTVRGWIVRRITLEEARSAVRREKVVAPQLQLFAGDDLGLKPVVSVQPGFLPHQIEIFRWMAEYYGDSLFDVIDNAVPKRVTIREEPHFTLTETGLSLLHDAERIAALAKRSPVQHQVLSRLESDEVVSAADLARLSASARKTLSTLEAKGLIARIAAALPESATEDIPQRPTLNERQRQAVESIGASLGERQFAPTLLFGVTGSGKTEVYIRLIEEVLRLGGSALVIVPEIALTPQLFDLFERRLRTPLALLHSQVVPTARWQAWRDMLRGDIRVAIGARSAIFAPLVDLKLIIVDEEHESSYKQSDGLRYHGRDVAVMRGKFEQCPVVLGSATPSFETLVNVQRKRYQLVELPERATSRPLPAIEIVDMNGVRRSEMPSENLSPRLFEAIQDTLEARGQVVILYNRRGFSSYLQCETCNEVVICPHCSVPMTVHKGSNRILCHYCNTSTEPPTHCRFCRDPRMSRLEEGLEERSSDEASAIGLLAPRGAGTERVVEELSQLFPQAVIVRLDRDTTMHRDAYREILGKMRSGEAQMLVGTQMIAKGHDLPGVTLVGIVDADVGLHTPDFRSSERTYQLITQAAGRAGRGRDAGKVIVQTREPNHPTIVATTTGRFTAFARFELEYRKKLRYPPWGKLLRIIISSPDAQDAFRAAELTRTAVDELLQSIGAETSPGPADSQPSVLGPAPAPHERLRGRYRWHLMVKTDSARALSRLAAQLQHWKKGVKGLTDFRLVLDIDPVDML